MSALGLAPIPWRFANTAVAQMWLWEVPEFQAKIDGARNSFHWELSDLVHASNGSPRFLSEGHTATFEEAERQLREAVGKSYPPRYGYRKYAGALATTFRILTGADIDFGPFEGLQTVLTVRTGNGSNVTYHGELHVRNYEITLTMSNGQTVKIQPAHIEKVIGENGATRKTQEQTGYTGMGRIYRTSRPQPGCNGKPGFLPNTVDHAGPPCPVHEPTARARHF